MPSRNPAVDTYIANAADFAKPILTHIRDVVHAAAPNIEEEIKWRFPFFTDGGEIVCSMQAFKAHCGLFFWKGALVVPDGKEDGMGQFGKLTSVTQLPSKKILAGYVKKALELNAAGVAAPHVAKRREKSTAAKSTAAKSTAAKSAKAPQPTPPELEAALKRNKKAAATWKAFAPSHRREYIEWITEAKRAETRSRRVAQTIEWIAEGKQRNWKWGGR